MSDQNQILRLLATIREECAAVRSRQEELYELLISYKDQLQDLKDTVVEKLAGLPKSPYIAGQLVPAPRKTEGVDEFRHLLATYLHKVTDGSDESDERPADFVYEKRTDLKPEEIQLEEDEDDRPRRSHGGGHGGSGGQPRPKRDNDLERGPDRDIEPIDLDDDEEDEDADEAEGGEDEGASREAGAGAAGDAGRRRKRRRRGGRGRKKEGGGQTQSAGDPGEASTPAASGD